MESKDPLLRKYLNDTGQIPLLTREEERELAIRKDNGDMEASKKLVAANLRFVTTIAKQYCKPEVPFNLHQLIEFGYLGLMHAVEKYDIEYGTRLLTYAVYWIRQRIGYEIRRHKKSTSLDAILETHDNEESLYDCINDKKAVPAEVTIDKAIIRKIVKEDIKAMLEPRERIVLRLRYGLGNRKNLTLSAIGLKLKLTKERVRQIQAKALRKLQQSQRLEGIQEHC